MKTALLISPMGEGGGYWLYTDDGVNTKPLVCLDEADEAAALKRAIGFTNAVMELIEAPVLLKIPEVKGGGDD